MSSDKETSVSIQDEHMVAVDKEFFFEGMPLPVSVYLRLTTDKYLIIGKSGEKAQFTNLHSLKQNQAKTFVRKIDHPVLIQFITDFTQRLVTHPQFTPSVKTKYLMGLTSQALHSFDGKEFASVAQLERVSQMVITIGQSMTGFDEIVKILEGMPADESKHSMSTCMVALMLCEEMQVTLQAAIEKVSLACLLHDIGLKFLPKTLLEKPKHLWSFEENQLYETHPLKGIEMLRDLKDVSQDVLIMIAEHHENAVGTGFPKKIRDLKISPLGRIVIVANYFCSLIFGREGEQKIYTAEEAIDYIENVLGQPFNKQVFLSLKNIVNKTYLQKKAKAAS